MSAQQPAVMDVLEILYYMQGNTTDQWSLQGSILGQLARIREPSPAVFRAAAEIWGLKWCVRSYTANIIHSMLAHVHKHLTTIEDIHAKYSNHQLLVLAFR